MHIAYFDEVKYQSGNQPYFWFGCLLVPSDRVVELENEVANLSRACFGRSTLSRNTEFHAADIFRGKANFKGVDINKRLEVLKKLVEILSAHNDVGRIFVRLNPSKMHTVDDLERRAFVFLAERIELELRAREDYGVLIGDKDRAKLSTIFAEDLSRYRETSTPYAYGGKLTKLIDTVHFTDSHTSRMLQLADTYVFVKQLCQRDPTTFPGNELVRYAREEMDFGYANRYKIWPK